MKKSVNPVSPLLLMIVPVLIFVGLSLSFKNQTNLQQEEMVSTSISTPSATHFVKVAGEQAFVKFLSTK